MSSNCALETFENALKKQLSMRCYDEFLVLQNVLYTTYIKELETEENYEKYFSMLDKVNIEYANTIKKQSNISQIDSKKNKILIGLPSLDNDFAHVELLASLIRTAQKNKMDISIFGFGDPSIRPKSKILTRLLDNGHVKLLKIPYSHQGILALVNFYAKSNFNRLAIYSIPMLLSVFIEVLGPRHVSWVSTKFKLSCFTHLESGISLTKNLNEQEHSCWQHILPGLPRQNAFKPHERPIGQRMLTINREEKIANPEFLSVIVEILSQQKDATFAWTGRERAEQIQNYFETHGVADRCEFIGWVDPGTTMHQYDFFLDTPKLSGHTAISAFASGLPTFFFSGSNNWIEAYTENTKYNENPILNRVLADTPTEYVGNVISCMNSKSYYLDRVALQQSFAEQYLYREDQASTDFLKELAG